MAQPTINDEIETAFADANIDEKTIFLMTDLEPDDMMAIKLIKTKLSQCRKIIVVIGEHNEDDLVNKCRLFYKLAKEYGFYGKLENKIYKGSPGNKEKKYPQAIFDEFITAKLKEEITKADVQFIAYTDDILTGLGEDTIFLLMKPPKELHSSNKVFTNSLAFMYGSFNFNEYYLALGISEIAAFSKIVTMFPKIVYIERKPEFAVYETDDTNGYKDPNPIFGIMSSNFDILGDKELNAKMTAAWTSITNENIDFCALHWQSVALGGVKESIPKFTVITPSIASGDDTITLLNTFKAQFFKHPMAPEANFEEISPGYYEGILDDLKLVDFYNKNNQGFRLILIDKKEKLENVKTELEALKKSQETDTIDEKIEKKIKKMEKDIQKMEKDIQKIEKKLLEIDVDIKNSAKLIAELLKMLAGNKWGMMIGIVLTDGRQTPLADQIISAVILAPQQFTLQKKKFCGQSVYTILAVNDDTKEDKNYLANTSYNDQKLVLYKQVLDIIANAGEGAKAGAEGVSGAVSISGGKTRRKRKRKSRKLRRSRKSRRSRKLRRSRKSRR